MLPPASLPRRGRPAAAVGALRGRPSRGAAVAAHAQLAGLRTAARRQPRRCLPFLVVPRRPPATSPQREGEPAWHRRQRRRRGAARALLRVAAAADLLNRHHSAPPMGGRGGGGGGKGGFFLGGKGSGGRLAGSGGDDAAWASSVGDMLQALQQQSLQQQRILQAICASGMDSQGGGGKGRGNQRPGAKGAGRNLGGARLSRAGDWECPQCHFAPNFAARSKCFSCGAARRGTAAAHGGAFTAGPVGAGGLRPQLAWGSARLGPAAGAPTYRVPGASVAAAAQAEAAAATTATAATPLQPRRTSVGPPSDAAAAAVTSAGGGLPSRRGNGGEESTHRTSDDGFQQVVHRSTRRRMGRQIGSGEGGKGASPGTTALDATPMDSEVGIGAAVNDDTHDDEAWEDDWLEDEAEAVEGAARQLESEDPSTLKQRLEREEATIRTLQREGVEPEHPTMVAAAAARDEAAERWKAARKPHPIARRMGWVQRSLDKAHKSQDKARADLADFDEQVKGQRQKFIERLERARERVRKHSEALEDLQQEAAEQVVSTRRATRGSSVCARLAGGMREKVAPSVAALAATLGEGTEAHGQLNLLMAQLESMQSELEKHASADTHDHEEFDIGDNDDRSDDEWSEGQDLDDGDDDMHVAPAETQDPRGLPRWRSKGYGRWNKDGGGGAGNIGSGKGTERHAAAQPTANTGSERPQTHSATECSATDTPPRAQAGTNSGPIATLATAAPVGKPEPTRVAQGDGDATSCKHRRGQAPEDTAEAVAAVRNASRAMELMQHQQQASSAGSFGSEAAVQAAAQLHTRNVSQVVAAAIAQGIQPLTADGDDLIMLGPQALSEWAAEHLKQGAWSW